jgi:aminoglycoside phosphotransferase family enzyme/predicted kinase
VKQTAAGGERTARHTSGDAAALIAVMSSPEFYPEPPDRVELRQTHTSYVFLVGDRVYKVRKPVAFAFIDCSTPERRRKLCELELRVNRRLAPTVYYGVRPLIYRNGKYSLGREASGADVTVDFALEMRRLPEDRRFDHRVEAGVATLEDVRRIAEHLVRFHATVASTEGWNYGSASAVWRLLMSNLQETADLVADPDSRERLELVSSFSRRFLTMHWEFLNQRARNGRVREGHGDLRGDSIYLVPDGITIIDALEFSERLRYGDVAAEVAFLAMDCDRLQRPDLAGELARAYGLAADDPDLEFLLPFYKCYRATVRAKVELLKSRQEDCSFADRALAREQARRYLELACSYSGCPPTVMLLVVCGLSGTGKSTVARVLQQRTTFTLLASDVERKRLAGVPPTVHLDAPYGAGVYGADFSAKVYRSLMAQAEDLLKAGRGVIIDATFLRRADRALVIDLAARSQTSPIFVECRASRDEVMARLTRRSTRANEISDANVAIYQRQLEECEALDEIPPARHVIADTTRAPEALWAELERRLFPN